MHLAAGYYEQYLNDMGSMIFTYFLFLGLGLFLYYYKNKDFWFLGLALYMFAGYTWIAMLPIDAISAIGLLILSLLIAIPIGIFWKRLNRRWYQGKSY